MWFSVSDPSGMITQHALKKKNKRKKGKKIQQFVLFLTSNCVRSLISTNGLTPPVWRQELFKSEFVSDTRGSLCGWVFPSLISFFIPSDFFPSFSFLLSFPFVFSSPFLPFFFSSFPFFPFPFFFFFLIKQNYVVIFETHSLQVRCNNWTHRWHLSRNP